MRKLGFVLVACLVLSTWAHADLIFLRDNGGIKRANLDGTGLTTILSGGGENAQGVFGAQILADIEVDPLNEKIYWQQSDGIYKANFDGTGKTAVRLDGVHSKGQGLALDVAGGKVYWGRSNGNNVQLYSANLDGTGTATQIESINTGTTLNAAWDVEVDASAGKLYFNKARDGDTHDGVWMANVTGAGAPVKVINTVSWGRGGIELDLGNGYVYSQTSNGPEIRRALLGGGSDTQITTTSSHSYIALHNNTLYGTANGEVHLYDLVTAPSDYDTGSPLITGLSGMAGIAIFAETGGGGVPEPATFALVALGALGLVARRR